MKNQENASWNSLAKILLAIILFLILLIFYLLYIASSIDESENNIKFTSEELDTYSHIRELLESKEERALIFEFINDLQGAIDSFKAPGNLNGIKTTEIALSLATNLVNNYDSTRSFLYADSDLDRRRTGFVRDETKGVRIEIHKLIGSIMRSANIRWLTRGNLRLQDHMFYGFLGQYDSLTAPHDTMIGQSTIVFQGGKRQTDGDFTMYRELWDYGNLCPPCKVNNPELTPCPHCRQH